MKTIILYYSKTGFTEQYALWLKEELKCDCFPYRDRQKIDFQQYDAIVFGSWCHAGTIQKIQWFQKQLPAWRGKKIAAFAVGAMPADGTGIEEMLRRNFMQAVRPFYFPGGLRYEKMGIPSRFMMKLFSTMMAKKTDKTAAEEEMARMLAKSYDLSDKKQLRPLIAYLLGPSDG